MLYFVGIALLLVSSHINAFVPAMRAPRFARGLAMSAATEVPLQTILETVRSSKNIYIYFTLILYHTFIIAGCP